jgi:two-component system sensor histidine kinase CiaH
MIVHKNSIKLAGLYLTIMMFISLFFSINVYQLSLQEFDRGLRRPEPALNVPVGPGFSIQIRDQLQQERDKRYEDAKDHVISRLLFVNFLILVGGGILSYFLALRTLKPIEEAHEAQSRFTADASHELRTPITAMRSENEVALMNPKLTLAQAKDQIKSNIEELEKLTELSDGLLRLARLENNHLKRESLEVSNLISRAVDRVLPVAEKKSILITNNTSTKAHVNGDESSLVEAIVILLDNAVKYSSAKSEVVIGAVTKQKNVVIEVTDSGIGIKAIELPYIFDRFYRADSSRSKREVTGYGLGLAIAKNIIEMHNGSLTVKSKPGSGSTFSITLST